MKYKFISITLILFLIVSCSIFSLFYEEKLSFVYHQHLEDSGDESACELIDKCSHLPIVNIDTRNQVVPGENNAISNELEMDYIIGDVSIYDNGNNVNYLGSRDVDIIDARIRYRGRSSLHFDKKGYLIKFVNKNNKKINKSFLGMPSDSDWVLHGPFIDKTLIRNYMWYNVSQEIMGEAPKTRFLELYIDNNYEGVYLAVESVTQSETSRVKMESIHKDSIATSYLIQLDADTKDEVTYLDSFSEYTYRIESFGKHPAYLSIRYPDEEYLNESVKKYIIDDFSKFEKMLFSFDYKEYEKYIDVDNFVDYFIINEFTQNYDALSYSTYIYKDISGKYKMYVWDFNLANNIYATDMLVNGEQDFRLSFRFWYFMLLKDEDFVEKVIKRYKELRGTYLSEEYLFNYIDESIMYLGNSVDRNFDRWGYSFEPEFDSVETHFHPRNYDEAVSQLKNAIVARGSWMDENIEGLRQYSHSSVNKKYNK